MTDKERYSGKGIDVIFDGARCIHSRMCVLGRPDVFVPNADGRWIHPEHASVDALVEIAHACPSGAIGYDRTDGGQPEQPPAVNLIRLRENGPYAFDADLTIAGAADGYRRTLCRCGASRSKPYCDGSHHSIGFVATGEPDSATSEPLAVRNGSLDISPLPNGPLKVEGAMELVSGTGRTIDRRTRSFLCRCGASARKPFCDGSHTRIGFSDAG
jgi:CDGSH-type Zn-finger protein/uncharacterized Fe-S cluster protein YjdI